MAEAVLRGSRRELKVDLHVVVDGVPLSVHGEHYLDEARILIDPFSALQLVQNFICLGLITRNVNVVAAFKVACKLSTNATCYTRVKVSTLFALEVGALILGYSWQRLNFSFFIEHVAAILAVRPLHAIKLALTFFFG